MNYVPGGTILDLKECRPDEYEGRIVVVNGAWYRIGAFLGQGAEKIVHSLVNVNSGLTLHVIKIFRDQQRITQNAAAMVRGVTELRRYFGKSVPNFLMEQSHNGWFEVQDATAALLPVPEPSPAGTAFAAGASAHRGGRPEQALQHFTEALHLNPYHSHAHAALANVEAQLGRPAEAIVAYETALAIEPNYCEYYLSLADLAYQLRVPFKTLAVYEAMKRYFPYQEDIDEVVAAALLACGEPEEALELLDDSQRQDLDEPTITQIREAADRMKAARQAAATAWQRGSEAVVARDDAAVRRAIDEALSLDPGDPWLLANDALHRVQLDEPDAKAKLFLALRFLPIQFHQACQVSLALHAQLAKPDSEHARQLIRDLGTRLPTAEELLEKIIPVPAALWIDLDGLQCVAPAITAGTLIPAAERAFAATGDPLFHAVAEVYRHPMLDPDADFMP